MKKLQRSRADRVFTGVCGGVARYFGVDADIVRLLWLVSIVVAGLGVLPYVAAIFLLPEADEAPGPSVPASKVAGFALLGLGIVFFFRTLDARVLDPTVLAFWRIRALGPLLLLGAGVLLVWPATRTFLGTRGRRPRRSLSDRVLSGVAGGIAREWALDPNVVRLAFVAAASLTFGLAVLLYVLLVVVLPEEAPARPAPPPAPYAASGPAAGPGPFPPGGTDQAVSGTDR